VLGKEQDAKSVSKMSLVAAEDSAPISADVPSTVMDETPEASSEEEPSKDDSPADPLGEGKPAAEESAPAPTRHRAVVLTSELKSVDPVSSPSKLFEKGLPGNESTTCKN